jgi:hypothetical protein
MSMFFANCGFVKPSGGNIPFADDFTGAQPGLWIRGAYSSQNNRVTISRSGGSFTITPIANLAGTNRNGYISGRTYPFGDGDYIQIEITTPINNTGVGSTNEFRFGVHLNSSNLIQMLMGGTHVITMRVTNAGVNTDGTVAFDAVGTRWWRIQRSGSNILFRTSSDGSTWTTQHTGALPAFSVAALSVHILAGTLGSTASPGVAPVANFSSSLVANALPSFVNTGSFQSSTASSTPGSLTDIQAGDMLVYFAETANQATQVPQWAEAPDSPAINPDATDATRLTAFWARYDGVSINRTATDSGDHTNVAIVAVRGCSPVGDPWGDTASDPGGTGTAVSIPGGDAPVDGCFAILAAATSRDFSGNTNFTGWSNVSFANLTERIDGASTNGTGGGLGIATAEKATAGAYGATAVTQATAVPHATWSGVLKPNDGTDEIGPEIDYIGAGPGKVTASGAATVVPDYPTSTIVAGDLLILLVAMKPTVSGGGGVTTPAGWTPLASLIGTGVGAVVADDGDTNIFAFYKEAAGTESGSLSVSLTGNNNAQAVILNYAKTGGAWSVAAATGQQTTTGSVSVTCGSDPGFQPDDRYIVAKVSPTDLNAATTAYATTNSPSQTGVKFAWSTQVVAVGNANGLQTGFVVYRGKVATGTSSSAPSVTIGTSGNHGKGPVMLIRVRVV